MKVAAVLERRIAFSEGNLHDIKHLVKVWGYLRGEKLVFAPKTGANPLILLGVILAKQRFSRSSYALFSSSSKKRITRKRKTLSRLLEFPAKQ